MARGGGFPFCLEAEGREASQETSKRRDGGAGRRVEQSNFFFLLIDMGTEEWVSEEFLN
jgi:hypothetical protein